MMKRIVLVILAGFFTGTAVAANAPVSDNTGACFACHVVATPSATGDWKKSHHSMVSPSEAIKKEKLERRVSTERVSDELAGNVVGCAECHMMNPDKHKDSFDHNGYKVHTIVTPEDCAVCHPEERKQYSANIMSEAHGNLVNNPLYHDLSDSVNGVQSFKDGKITLRVPDAETNNDSCLFCHGTAIEVKGMISRSTKMGDLKFPVLIGWPNQGVGRVNPDGSKGTCTSCHARHSFSIEMARKPATCSECHKGPDVPAYKVYEVSKHGNIYSSFGKKWDFEAVPWVVGRDLTAPTCATCHVSLVTTENGRVVAERTHQMNNRIAWRLFGLIYAHPHPKSPDTTIIKNKIGLPLPTELTGEPVAGYLIDAMEQINRTKAMQDVCLACHSQGWVNGHFARYENTIKICNDMTLTATKIMLSAWDSGVAKGLAQGDSIFNEAIEKMWVEQWLFFANSTRFASAMAGADYGVFAEGRWHMAKNIQEMMDRLEFKRPQKKSLLSAD